MHFSMIHIQNPVSEMTIDMHCYLILIFFEKYKEQDYLILGKKVIDAFYIFALVDSF